MVKFSLYIFSLIVVMYAIDGVNINAIFKKNQVMKARLFYFIIILCMTYLLANFMYDFTTVFK
jgi:uncharacterized membrane protein YwzB